MQQKIIPIRGGGHITEVHLHPQLADMPRERLAVDKRGWIFGLREVEWPVEPKSVGDLFGSQKPLFGGMTPKGLPVSDGEQ